jgi:hypothetical protein
MSMPEMIGELLEISSYTNKENKASQLARESIAQSLSAGASVCAKIGNTIWERGTYVNPHTGETGFAHQILGGRPGTSWNKFYNTLTGIAYYKQ